MSIYRLCAPFTDPSGYGEFARYFAYTIFKNNNDGLCTNIKLSSSIENIKLDHKYDFIKSKFNKNIKPDINIVFMIPPLFSSNKTNNAKNVGFTMFEASGLPEGWADMCNTMDAICVPSEWNKQTFSEAGVKKPIFVVPPGMELDDELPIKPTAPFTFYSIFQWTERKNPTNLIKAYFIAMQDKTDVNLILKTYADFRLPNNRDIIVSHIEKIKKDLKLKRYPPIQLITDRLSNEDISNLHKTSHVLLSPHRGEGWNMPAMHAMYYGNTVIATNYSGNTQFMTKDNSILLDYFRTPCYSDNSFAPFFNGNMFWAEPNVEQLIDNIRWCYNNQSAVSALGLKARTSIINNFNMQNSYNALLQIL